MIPCFSLEKMRRGIGKITHGVHHRCHFPSPLSRACRAKVSIVFAVSCLEPGCFVYRVCLQLRVAHAGVLSEDSVRLAVVVQWSTV